MSTTLSQEQQYEQLGILIKLEALTRPSRSSTWVQIEGMLRVNNLQKSDQWPMSGRRVAGGRRAGRLIRFIYMKNFAVAAAGTGLSVVHYLLRQTVQAVKRFKNVLRNSQLADIWEEECTGKCELMEIATEKHQRKTKGFEINGANCKQMQRIIEDFAKERLIVQRRSSGEDRAVLEGDKALDLGGGCRGSKLEACCCDVRAHLDLGTSYGKTTADSKSDSAVQPRSTIVITLLVATHGY
ncbi:hypothetical protein B0H14DRAFT_2637192 [Mycena olivaceomarginata]|nr:hypothetical protein B0H14DRAFT_2637192 [Mycena olivaceomarginata]